MTQVELKNNEETQVFIEKIYNEYSSSDYILFFKEKQEL